MALLLIYFINFKWLDHFYYIIFCLKNIINELTYLINTTYIKMGYEARHTKVVFHTARGKIRRAFKRSI